MAVLVDIIHSGSELWLAYRQLGEEHPELIEWKVDHKGNLVFNLPESKNLRRDQERDTRYYQGLTDWVCVSEHTESSVNAFLDSLKPQHRELAHIVFYDGGTKQEAAERLGVTRKTLYNWLATISGAAVQWFGGGEYECQRATSG